VKEGIFALPDESSTLPSGRVLDFEPPMPDAQFDWTRAKLLNLDATLTKQNFLAFLENFDDTEKNRDVNRSQAKFQMSLRTVKKEPQCFIDEEQHKKEPPKRNTAPLLIG
jgi:hypothetical protein